MGTTIQQLIHVLRNNAGYNSELTCRVRCELGVPVYSLAFLLVRCTYVISYIIRCLFDIKINLEFDEVSNL